MRSRAHLSRVCTKRCLCEPRLVRTSLVFCTSKPSARRGNWRPPVART